MRETMAMVLGTAGWVTGLVLLVVMAALPLLERWGAR